MIRVGAHYLEPRRIGYFLVEALVSWLVFVAAAGTSARALHAPLEPAWLVWGLGVTAAVEVGLYLGDLHDWSTALADAPAGRRALRALGVAVFLVGGALAFSANGPRASLVVVGLGAVGVTTLGLRAALPLASQLLGLRTRIFLVGDGRAAHLLAREVRRDGGAEVIGFAGPRTTDLARRARAAGATTVVVASDDRRGLPVYDLLLCRASGLEVIDAGTLAARVLHRLPVELVRPSDLIYNDGFARPAWLCALRRALSLAGALCLGALTWPLLCAAAVAIRLDSPGPVLYRQARAGKDGRPFSMLKFRTMRPDAETAGPAWAQAGDSRVTRVGRILRRFRIDELPQLWNVLRGDMELVGPRPERPAFVEQLRRKIPYYDLRHTVAPGITGYAQVLYPYAASIEEAKEKLQYDLYYVRYLSLELDLYVLLMTAKVVLFGRGAR